MDWSSEEEQIIAAIQQTESVPRIEAIRRMQRRKKSGRSRFAGLRACSVQTGPGRQAERLCRSPRCTRGDDGGPASLAHLRANARYCDATCKKAARRSRRLGNPTTNRQCLCGSKGGQIGPLVHPYHPAGCAS
jgi:hypothetical protein